MNDSTPALTRGVHHLGLTVPDIEATRDFFVDVLGFRQVGEKPSYPAVFVSDGTVTLTLWQAEDPATATPFDRKTNVGLHHLALALPDQPALDALHDRLQSVEGVAIEFGPEPLGKAGTRHLMCTIPGGVRLELVAPAEAPSSDRPRSDVAFTPAVKRAQAERGSREVYERFAQRRDFRGPIDEQLAAFVAERDHFYLGTTSSEGQPYIQHRGGPQGFLKVLDEHRLAFADYAGNRQYITVGNLSENPRAFLFLMDYPNRRRIKVWGRAEVVEDDPALLARVVDTDYGATPERAMVFHVESWDINCRQHITPRFTREELSRMGGLG